MKPMFTTIDGQDVYSAGQFAALNKVSAEYLYRHAIPSFCYDYRASGDNDKLGDCPPTNMYIEGFHSDLFRNNRPHSRSAAKWKNILRMAQRKISSRSLDREVDCVNVAQFISRHCVYGDGFEMSARALYYGYCMEKYGGLTTGIRWFQNVLSDIEFPWYSVSFRCEVESDFVPVKFVEGNYVYPFNMSSKRTDDGVLFYDEPLRL